MIDDDSSDAVVGMCVVVSRLEMEVETIQADALHETLRRAAVHADAMEDDVVDDAF